MVCAPDPPANQPDSELDAKPVMLVHAESASSIEDAMLSTCRGLLASLAISADVNFRIIPMTG